MSVRESSDAHFTRWPGLLSLSLGVLLGPVVALVTQGLIYSTNSWTCGRDIGATMHVIPALSVIVSVGAGVGAYLNWRAIGKGVEDEHGAVATRTRFLALMGIALSAFSTLVILAMWLSIFVFAPCMRA
jgi:hypothetical protein